MMQNKMRDDRIMCAALTLAMLGAASVVLATTRTVGLGGAAPNYTTISNALVAASNGKAPPKADVSPNAKKWKDGERPTTIGQPLLR